MRAVFTVTNDLNYDQRMIRICTALVDDGWDVLLVGRKRSFSVSLAERPFRQKRIKCWFNKGFLFYTEYNFRLFLFLLFVGTDIFGAIDLDTILPNVIVAKLRRKKCIFDAHEYFTEVPEVAERNFVKKVWAAIGFWAIPKVDAAYTVSESLARIFTKIYKKKFDLIRNVPLVRSFPEIEKSNHAVILYQGALNEGRGIEALLEAMPNINAQLVLVGEGDLSEELRKLCQHLGLDHKVTFTGYLPPEELARLTLTATIGYNVLEPKGMSYYYSLSNKFFDYIQAGVPSLSSNFPEYVNILRQYPVGLTCECDPADISSKINSMLNDAAKYQKMVSVCREASGIYNWNEESKKLIAVYERFK